MFPETLKYEKAQDLPGVVLDIENNKFEFTGRSFPADADAFYQPILLWLEEYKKAKYSNEIVFNFNLEYFNTASAKLLLDVFFKLEDIKEAGANVQIKWHYLDDDEDMFEAGEEFEDIIELDFEYLEYTEELT